MKITNNGIYDNDGKKIWTSSDIPEDAPIDTKNYVRKGRQWVEAPTGSTPTGDTNIDGGNARSSFTGTITLDGNA